MSPRVPEEGAVVSRIGRAATKYTVFAVRKNIVLLNAYGFFSTVSIEDFDRSWVVED